MQDNEKEVERQENLVSYDVEDCQEMKKRESKKEKELKHEARRISIQEGIFATIKNSFGNRYLSPFAIAINASNSMVALIGSIGGLLGPLTQMFSSRLLEKYSRKKIVLRAVFWEALLWIPMILIALLYMNGIIVNILPLFFLLFFSFSIIIGATGFPAWFSWMGDIVDDDYRGRWFSKKDLIHGFIGVVLAILASIFLDFFRDQGWEMYGFITLFTLAGISRIISWVCMKKQYEPKMKMKKGYYFSFSDFLFHAPKNNFGRFTIFRAILSISTSMVGVLIAIYLLRQLQFSYFLYIVITTAGGIFSLLLIETWGKISDRFGNYKILVITSFVIPTIPILWILNTNPIYLIIVPSIIGGIAWGGFNLAAGNFIYDNVTHDKRGLAISYYNMVHGVGIFLGGGLGAILIKYINTTTIKPIAIIFIISSILRTLTIIIGIPLLKEKKKEKIHQHDSVKKVLMRETVPTIVEEFHELMQIKSYIFNRRRKYYK